MKTIPLLLFFLTFAIGLVAQNISGEWNGILVQEEGGLATQYYFSMHIEQDGKSITGVSKIHILNKPKEYGRMEFKGTFDGKVLTFEDVNIKESKLSYGVLEIGLS